MKKSTLASHTLIALAALVPHSARAAVTPLAVTGWNQDMIMDPGFSSYNQSITGTLDNGAGNIEGYTFAEAGDYAVQPDGHVETVPGLTNGIYTSATGSGTTFQFQDFNANNSLLLTGGGDSGTLALLSPSAMTTLAIIGASSNGPTTASVTFTFSDSTTSTYIVNSGITSDWYSGSIPALAIGNRLSDHKEDGYQSVYYDNNPIISIFESDITLSAADQAKAVTSFTITNIGGGASHIGVMAVSADVVPEASTAAFLGACGALALIRRRRA